MVKTEIADLDKANLERFQEVANASMEHAPNVNHTKPEIDEAVRFITGAITEADKAAIPRIVRRSNCQRQELPPEIVAKLNEKRSLRNQMQRTGDTTLKPRINRLGKEIKKDKKSFDEQKLKDKWTKCKDKGIPMVSTNWPAPC